MARSPIVEGVSRMASKLQLAAVLVVLGSGGTAAAEIDAYLTVVPGKGTAAPMIEAMVSGAPRIPMEQITLRDPRGVVVPASELVEFRDSEHTMAVAIVFNGQEIWIGNTDFEADDSPARYPGALAGLRRGVDAMDLGRALPPGSKATLISFADTAQIKVPMGPAAAVTGAAVGIQKDFYAKFGTALVEGTSLAITELEEVRADRKLLIVVSDGNDTNPDAAKSQLAELRKRAVQGRIQIVSIIYKGVLSDSSSVVTTLAPRSITVASDEGIIEQMREAIRRATSDYTVWFPGERLRWDGTHQEVTLRFGREEIDPVTLTMGYAPPASPATPWFLRWWAQLAAGALLVGVIVGVARMRGRAAI